MINERRTCKRVAAAKRDLPGERAYLSCGWNLGEWSTIIVGAGERTRELLRAMMGAWELKLDAATGRGRPSEWASHDVTSVTSRRVGALPLQPQRMSARSHFRYGRTFTVTRLAVWPPGVQIAFWPSLPLTIVS